MRSALGRGKTFDEAVEAALAKLGQPRENVDIKVVAQNSMRVIVRATRKSPGSDPETAAKVRDLVAGMFAYMGCSPKVDIRSDEDPIILDITGERLGFLIGKQGFSLKYFQQVVNVMCQALIKDERQVVVDVDGYRKRREQRAREIAFRAAEQVKRTGDPIILDPMPSFERRSIHLALEGDPDVVTTSIGEEPERRVVVEPRRKSEEF
jgi:spoIIIJ-associated protein